MTMIAPGVYSDDEDKPFEVESGYYLDFQIICALFSIENILNRTICNLGLLKNKYQYYHYYCDHLIFSIGQIANRFDVKDSDAGLILERKNANIRNFDFSKTKYPILSDKKIRNTIEHIDEHNQKIIKKHCGVGGFNLIDTDTDADVVTALTTNKKIHPYTMDLLKRTLLKMRNDSELTLNLEDLRNELLALQESVRSLLGFVTDEFWREI